MKNKIWKAVSLPCALFLAVVMCLYGTAVPCAAAKAEEPIFAFAESRTVLAVGQQTKLPLIASDGYDKITYRSSKPDVISVDDKGNVTAHQKGIATITAKVSSQIYAHCVVQVVVPAAGVVMNQQVLYLDIGKTYRLKAQVTPSNTSYRQVKWSSRSDEIVGVENGVVSARSKGMTLIVAETEDGVKGYCLVIVRIPVTSVTADSTNISLTKGETRTVQTTVLPTNADDKTLTWKTSRPDVVTVNEKGMLTAVGVGKATIKAIAHNNQRVLLSVQVYEPIRAVSLSSSSVTLGCGERHVLTAAITPTQVADNTLTWSSSAPSVVAVNNGVIYAQSVGRATITVRSVNGRAASCVVEVKNAPNSVQLTPASLTIGVGESCQLRTTLPNDTASYSIHYTSSDPTICNIDSTGRILGKKNGKTTVTVRLFNGRTATTTVCVKTAPVSMTLDDNEMTLSVGQIKRLYTHIDGAHASYQRRFSTNNPAVAAVDTSGNITAKAIGSAIITVTTYNNVQAFCRVTVQTLPTYVQFREPSVLVFTGETHPLAVSLPDNSTSTRLTYTVQDTAVCTVNSSGVLTGVTAGQTTVTVTTVNGKQDTCTVTVKKSPSVLRLYVKQKKLMPGQTFQLYYYLGEPDEATSGVTYTSSDPSVCRVDSSGQVSAVAVGTAYITLTTHNGKKAVCQIIVANSVGVPLPLHQRFTPIGQYPELPTGCEITALAMVLNFYGYPIDKCTLVDDYLETAPAWEADFHEVFAGDPYSEYSYGCYAPAIVKAANRFLVQNSSSLRSTECSGQPLENLFRFTDNGTPVMVWTTYQLWPGYYTDTWTANNGKTVTWYRNEHCMVLLGHTDTVVYLADPTYGKIMSYDKALFALRYEELFRQAVVIN